jgi:hypothetical protein
LLNISDEHSNYYRDFDQLLNPTCFSDAGSKAREEFVTFMPEVGAYGKLFTQPAGTG